MSDTTTLTTVRAAGAVVCRRTPAGPLIALVHRPRYDDWTLPKGKLARGENIFAAAVREVEEETGVRAPLGPYLGELRYRRDQDGAEVEKVVSYWAMSCTDAPSFSPTAEIDEVRWLPPREAYERLSHAHDREPIERFAAMPTITATVLLVRHGRAGSRQDWRGDDRLRPLDKVGVAQSRAVAVAAPLFGACRVLSPDLVRCVDTVRPLADRLGLPVTIEPAWSEDSYAADPQQAYERLLDVVALGGTSVVCSQGGAIPGLVSRLTAESGLSHSDVPSRKGSVWALFHGPDRRLVAADYYANVADPV